jgi:hypothetical protein
MTEFEKLLELREQRNVEHSNSIKAMQSAFEAECKAVYRVKFPKRKFTMQKSFKDSQPEHGEIYKKWNEKFDSMWKEHSAAVEKIGEQLKEAAKGEEIPAFDGMTIYRTVDSGAYRSQGSGQHRYARADAEDHADKVKAYGLTAYIQEVLTAEGRDCCGYSYRCIDYHVWASTSQLGVEILERKPEKETMAEWVKKCDARGVNCKVFCPWLP